MRLTFAQAANDMDVPRNRIVNHGAMTILSVLDLRMDRPANRRETARYARSNFER